MKENGKFPNGLAEAMQDIGIGPTDLARAVATSKQNIERWAAQKRKIPLDFAEKIAKQLERLPAEIMLPTESRQGLNRVRLVSWVSAGKLTRGEAQDVELGTVLTGGLPRGDWIALRVEGDSMDRISPPESIIFVNRRDKKLIPNGLYVIADAEGNATYKRYRTGPPPRFEAVSTNQNIDPIYPQHEPTIIGRVRRTILDM
jgi:SOS-response transcriptional repressor LexA